MKKLLLLCFITLPLCYSTTLYAQDVKETTDIKEIKVRYCNDPVNTDIKSLFIDAKVDQKSVICIDFINTANKKANIGINFVDGAITDDTDQKKACLAEGEKSNFWQYVSNYPETLEIAPNSAKRVFVDLLYSGWFAGTSYGCLTYHALEQTGTQNVNGTMFNIFSRVGSFIDAFVAGDFTIKLVTTPIQSDFYTNIASNPNFIVYREGSWKEWFWKSSFWTYKAKVDITNSGNIAVTGDINITTSTWKIFATRTSINEQIFLPKQTRSFEVEIPWYSARWLGGFLNVSAHVEYKAIYLGSYATTAPKEAFTLVDTTEVFFFPWILLIIIGYGVWRFITRKLHTTQSPVVKKKTLQTITKKQNTLTKLPNPLPKPIIKKSSTTKKTQ
jgi:hypothetical protein